MSGAVGHDRALAERYALERELGRGGMGVVYLATDLRHGRSVAIKFLPSELASAVGAARFHREIRTLAGLTHPHILPLHDSGDANGELYYVMPRVEGESLRERLDREGPMRVGAALRIARQIADALAYAHAAGVVHRDIKPENVLLDRGGHAWVADFGIARVLEETAGHSGSTSVAVRVGSPPYMSPEQIAGESHVDGRSDLYALGCVLFEMLAGAPPFAHDSQHAIMRRHLVERAPSLRDRRADVGPALDRLVASLLAKQPEDRCASADVLIAALDAELGRLTGEGPTPVVVEAPAPSPRRRRIIVGASIAALALLAGWMAQATGLIGRLTAPPADPDRLLVLPLQWADGSAPSDDQREDLRLYAAFDRWADLDLVPRLSVLDELDVGGSRATLGSGADLARRMGAGRVVSGVATRVGDSLRIDLTLVANGSDVRRVSAYVGAGDDELERYALAADSLLFGRVSWDAGPEWDIGTALAGARLAYGAAYDALARWDIARADSLFQIALAQDPSFARASLWRSQLNAWRGDPAEVWVSGARSAMADTSRLTEREGRLAEGLTALGEQRFPDACRIYASLVADDDRDAAAWFGLAECQIRDPVVVRDRHAPTGWRFRASYAGGVRALQTAFELAPGSLVLYRENAFARLLDDVLYTRRNRLRPGRNVAGERFYARPAWNADSLVFVPHLERVPAAGPGLEEAIHRQKIWFAEIARGWSIALPNTLYALHAVALALEVQGDGAAVDTLLRARALARGRAEEIDLAIREVWLRIKLGLPRGADLAGARLLADSLLNSPDASAHGLERRLAPLAVLLGRPTVAARHARGDPAAIMNTDLPSALASPAAALLVYSAVGAPADSIAELERAVEAAVSNTLPPSERQAARRALLERSAILAHSIRVFAVTREPDVLPSEVARAQAAFSAGDREAALDTVRQVFVDTDATPDMAYAIAALAAQAGDSASAARVLDASLNGIEWLHPGIIENVAHAGALVRSMVLRAEIAATAGDSATAARWARAVTSLWGTGSPQLSDVVERMRILAGTR